MIVAALCRKEDLSKIHWVNWKREQGQGIPLLLLVLLLVLVSLSVPRYVYLLNTLTQNQRESSKVRLVYLLQWSWSRIVSSHCWYFQMTDYTFLTGFILKRLNSVEVLKRMELHYKMVDCLSSSIRWLWFEFWFCFLLDMEP